MEFAKLETIVKVQEDVNVCIVCPPLVVIVPPVELGEIQSEPLVAYEIIIIPLQPVPHQFKLFHHPHHPPKFAVPLLQTQVLLQFHHHPVHQVQADQNQLNIHHPPHPAYVIDAPDIEFAVPFHQFHPAVSIHQVPFPAAPPPPEAHQNQAVALHPFHH